VYNLQGLRLIFLNRRIYCESEISQATLTWSSEMSVNLFGKLAAQREEVYAFYVLVNFDGKFSIAKDWT